MEEILGFMFTRHVNNESTNRYWNECYRCIRKLYPTNQIVIIDDKSNKNFLFQEQELDNVLLIESEFPGAGEVLPYYYFDKLYGSEIKFNKAMIFHDSVFLKSHVNTNLVKDVNFLWDFEHDWDENTMTMDLLKRMKHGKLLAEFYLHKHLWVGCFGVQSVITIDFLRLIDQKYNFLLFVKIIKKRSERCRMERVFAVVCTYEKQKSDPSIFGNIHKYIKWGYDFDKYKSENLNMPIIKCWTGR